ncbi:MAG: tryptophan synthase subunit alpha [Acidimicrobiia bacterium]|nr:tryptophan synthase subunit alpha [Acidimicrobiia bacterium]MYC57197.1 tryptophan synthase subunit alpha [Acidimicrobiia bacterium]MYI29879.1 tryptophan synthase subunit alpha [Acidimicrobiia bacterium]
MGPELCAIESGAIEPGIIEVALGQRCSSGGKALVTYLTGGLGQWQTALLAAADAGADVLEVGIPFSDPVMDGPVIQEANDHALVNGATPLAVLEAIGRLDIGVPVAVMTYYNIVFRFGLKRFASVLASCGVAGAILADMPLEEAGPWVQAADAAGVETILLAAPTASEERLERICERSRGFVYGVGLLGVTGVRSDLAASAAVIAKRLKPLTHKPVLVGVGVGTPEQAQQVCQIADGVVVGSALVRCMLEENDPSALGLLVSQFRKALD